MANKTTKKKARRKKATKKKARKSINPSRDPSDKCQSKTYYTATHALLLTLQKVTGKATHEIMTDLTQIQEQMLVDYELNPLSKTCNAEWKTQGYWPDRWWNTSQNGTQRRRTTKFPGTDIYVTCNITITWYDAKWKENNYSKDYDEQFECDANTNIVHANFYMPQKKICFDSNKISEIMMEGAIFDISSDIEDIDFKDSITPAEKRARQEAKQEAKRLKKLAKKKAKTKTDTKK